MTTSSWQPSSTIQNLKLRTEILTKIRQFFAQKNVLEVETPLLCTATATDPYIDSFNLNSHHYLQTSPEFAMKRLLAAGSGCIFQICKAFRDDEIGKWHNPEFTMLEWYRVGFNHHDLMQEMIELFIFLLDEIKIKKYSYHEIFEKYLNINPHTDKLQILQNCAAENNLEISSSFINDDRDSWLRLLLHHLIEPKINSGVVFIYDFPIGQAALAKLNKINDMIVAERFEVYLEGIELANGYHELTDHQQQKQRFLDDLEKRNHLNYSKITIDEYLLAALQHGLPDCAGVALGVDRLLMYIAQAKHIKDVLSFNWNNV